jgi:hypothetical protein
MFPVAAHYDPSGASEPIWKNDLTLAVPGRITIS